jgi:putative transposase
MPQSLASVLVHLIFSTKHRQPFIRAEIESQLHPYMATVFRSLDSPTLILNGTEDHIHVLFCLSRKKSMAEVVEEIKTSSSKWIKSKGWNTGISIGKTATGLFPSANQGWNR